MSKQEAKKEKESIFKNRPFTVVMAFVILLILIFIIKLIPTSTPETTNMQKLDKQETSTEIVFKKEGTLSFIGNDGKVLSSIDIELADTDAKRIQGLMYRKTMDINQGMFFIFPIELPQSFWMKNTILSLDIMYVNVDKKIVKIHKNAVPFSEESLPSIEPALYVVEVNAGYSDKFGIKEGDTINWSLSN